MSGVNSMSLDPWKNCNAPFSDDNRNISIDIKHAIFAVGGGYGHIGIPQAFPQWNSKDSSRWCCKAKIDTRCANYQ